MSTERIPITQARQIVLDNVVPGPIEYVTPLEAQGRVVAQDLTSDIDCTPFDDSAMDGFCMRSEDLQAASEENPVSLTIVGYIGAGAVYEKEVQPGECVRIMTGAPVPAGADTVVKIELVETTGEGVEGDSAIFKAPSEVGHNIRFAGEEAHAGDVVVRAGDIITPAGAGLLAATGNLKVPVYARPKVAVINTGSELVEADEVPGPGQIRNSNKWMIAANITANGGIPVFYPQTADDSESIEALFRQAISECDMIVSTGGACNGDFDLVPAVLEKLGTMLFHVVNMKPGKSQPFGLIDGKPVFVLSGNPAAAAMGCEMFVRIALKVMQGFSIEHIDRVQITAALGDEVVKKDPRQFVLFGTLEQTEDGYTATPLKKQSSALFGSFQKANCLIVTPEGKGTLEAGTPMETLIL